MSEYHPLFFILFSAFAISGGVVLLASALWILRQNSNEPYTNQFAGLLVTMAVWSLFGGVQVLTNSLYLKVTILTVLSMFAIFVAPLWAHFATIYTGKTGHKHRILVYSMYLIAGVFAVIMATNHWHHMYWSYFEVIDIGWDILWRERTPLFWISYLWAYTTVIGSIILVGYRSLETSNLHQKKLVIYVVGPFIPMGFELFSSMGFTPYFLDFAPIGFTIWGFLLVYVFYSHAFYNVSPIGRKFAFESIENPVIIFDQNGLLTDWNEQANQLLTTNPGGKEWMGSFDDSIRSQLSEEIQSNIEEFRNTVETNINKLAKGDIDEIKIDGESYDGVEVEIGNEDRVYNIQFTPITPNESLRGYVIVFYDITMMIENKRKLEKQNQRLEQFASMVSHDLRNPITVAKGYLDMVDDDVEYTDDVGDALERMEDIISEILVLAREDDAITKSDTVDINEVAADAWDLVNTFNGTLESTVDMEIEADRKYLLSVFENIFRNTYDHCEPDTTVYVGELTDNDGFFIADDGPGIPLDVQEHIFDEGYTTSDSGNGLGLFIVEKIVEGHGWSISIDNDTDEYGAKFDITTKQSKGESESEPETTSD